VKISRHMSNGMRVKTAESDSPIHSESGLKLLKWDLVGLATQRKAFAQGRRFEANCQSEADCHLPLISATVYSCFSLIENVQCTD
jgi:hypothetical protein